MLGSHVHVGKPWGRVKFRTAVAFFNAYLAGTGPVPRS